MNKSTFDIPVALFLFLREEKSVEIIKRISKIKPSVLYLIADGGRTKEEHQAALRTRAAVEKEIDWECKVIKRYADENVGVYGNIGEGAKWVLSQEKWAIFIEDDNLPELTFFEYCKELLIRYEKEERVLWICGTNYLGKYDSPYSYMFTSNLLPCGWASWSKKFLKYYDGELETFEPERDWKVLKAKYRNKALAKQDFNNFCVEKQRYRDGRRFISWDYQMAYTLRKYDLIGISPVCNQIKNIGVDSLSIHGGSSESSIMTQRLCGMDSFPLEFPLRHPTSLVIDKKYEHIISRIILVPLKIRARNSTLRVFRKILHVQPGEHLKDKILFRSKKRK